MIGGYFCSGRIFQIMVSLPPSITSPSSHQWFFHPQKNCHHHVDWFLEHVHIFHVFHHIDQMHPISYEFNPKIDLNLLA